LRGYRGRVTSDRRNKRVGARGRRQRPATNGRRPQPASTAWAIAFYKAADDEVPSKAFLNRCPGSVLQMLLAIVVAVRDAPPPAFPASQMWHAMHGEMKGFHEARDEHHGAHYRLFCVVDRQAPQHGLDAPTVALISGGVKPARTAMPQNVYDEALEYRRDYLATRRIVLPAGIPEDMRKA
jgi:hypothetical protein